MIEPKYMKKKELFIEQELADALQKLYVKHVPATVGDYIDETADNDSSGKKPIKHEKVEATPVV